MSLIKPCKTVESDLNLVVIAVESFLSLVVIALESVNIFALSLVVKSVESNLILLAKAVESKYILALKAAESLPNLSFILETLSVRAEPEAVPKAVILRDSEAVSRANLLDNIVAVSAIFTFKLIRALRSFELSII